MSKRVSELVVLAVSDESTTTIHAMLVLDSNQLRHVLPGNPALLMVKAAAHRGGHTLATTDIVLHEVLRWHREELHLKIKALRAAVREVNTLMPPGLTIPDPPRGVLPRGIAGGFETKRLEEALREDFRVLVTEPADALEALFREANRRPPCKANGEGARDAAIFLTALRAYEPQDKGPDGQDLPLLFVSQDKAFSDAADRSRLAPGLLADAGDRSVVICADVVSALSQMGFPYIELDPKEIISRTDFLEILRNAMLDSMGSNFSPTSSAMLSGSLVPHLPQLRERGRWARQCSADGMTMTSVEGSWSCTVDVIRLGAPDGFFYLSADISALVVQDSDGNVIEAEFAPMSVRL